MRLDRWNAIVLAGAALLGGGVWANWSPGWACILWGLLLLGVAGLHTARAGRG